ncbi:MAG TPA: cytochrome c [Candidatus Acidoferrales bacterium]|nr:cytochrome c [Candidatus Acidoferrales bacterium]
MNRCILRIAQTLFFACGLVFFFHTSTRAADSASLFKTKCAMCHAANGSGDNMMGKRLGAKDLRSSEVQKKTDAELDKEITDGIPPKMPSYKSTLTAADIKGLVSYIRELGKKK